MKCGTDALWAYLNRHPDVQPARNTSIGGRPSPAKELRAFHRKEVDLANYEHITRAADVPRPVVFDASPLYIADHVVPRNIRSAFGTQGHRFIIILRSPIARMYSQYRYQRALFLANRGSRPAAMAKVEHFESFSSLVRWCIDTLREFEAGNSHLAEDPDRLWRAAYGRPELLGSANPLLLSMYDAQMHEWLTVFPSRASYCVISQEQLLVNPAPTLTLVSRFVGLAPFDWTDVRITAHSHTTTGTPQLNEPIPIEAALRAELEAVISRYGSTYWDEVHTNGSIGCSPRYR